MKEKNGGGYRELEQEIIENSIKEFLWQKAREDLVVDFADYDPRTQAVERTSQAIEMVVAKEVFMDALGQ